MGSGNMAEAGLEPAGPLVTGSLGSARRPSGLEECGRDDGASPRRVDAAWGDLRWDSNDGLRSRKSKRGCKCEVISGQGISKAHADAVMLMAQDVQAKDGGNVANMGKVCRSACRCIPREKPDQVTPGEVPAACRRLSCSS